MKTDRVRKMIETFIDFEVEIVASYLPSDSMVSNEMPPKEQALFTATGLIHDAIITSIHAIAVDSKHEDQLIEEFNKYRKQKQEGT